MASVTAFCLLFSPVLQRRRLFPAISFTGTTRPFSPISSAALPSHPTGGEDATSAGGASKEKFDSGGGGLQGSDILLAMQRAAARKDGGGGQKSGRKGKKRRGSRSGEERDQVLPEDYDYSSVRPVEIGRDWGARIDELERRILDLRSRYHY